MSTTSSNSVGDTSSGFLRFNKNPPKVRLTGEDSEPDPLFYDHLVDEGFDVEYLPYDGGGPAYRERLKRLHEDLELGQKYAVVAFGDAAAACLDVHTKPQRHLAASIAYYPSGIPDPKTKFPPHLHVLSHVAGSQGFAPIAGWSSHTYRNTAPGFAEHDLSTFDPVAASLAWTRTLGALRKAFELDGTANLERPWEEHLTHKYGHRDALATIKTFVDQTPYANYVPTMTGGVGQKDLFIFYRDYFIPSHPPSLHLKLVSRTLGVDRLVDEMILSFKHTQEVPHILPGVPPTGKDVRIAAVSVVTFRGGMLVHEHMYWDQASVLVQVGLLDPQLVPHSMRQKGMQRMPVMGAEQAEKVLDEESQPSNELIPGWKDRPKGDPGVQSNRVKSAT